MTASLPGAPLAFTAASASPGNVLAALRLDPPPSLSATARADARVDLAWPASPTATSRAVEYAVLRRASGTSSFAEVARVAALAYTDAPPAPGAYDYVVRAVISSFSSADSAVASVSTPP